MLMNNNIVKFAFERLHVVILCRIKTVSSIHMNRMLEIFLQNLNIHPVRQVVR